MEINLSSQRGFYAYTSPGNRGQQQSTPPVLDAMLSTNMLPTQSFESPYYMHCSPLYNAHSSAVGAVQILALEINKGKELASKEEEQRRGSESGASPYVICRRGNDSQRAVQILQKLGSPSATDIVGGLEGAHEVDPSFPTY